MDAKRTGLVMECVHTSRQTPGVIVSNIRNIWGFNVASGL